MTSDAFSEKEGHEVRRIVALLRKMPRSWPIVLIALGVAALAYAGFNYLRHPKYQSETVLLYTQGVTSADPLEQQAQNPRNASLRLKELLFSRPRLAGIVARFGLYPDVVKQFGVADAAEELKRHVEFRTPGGDTFSIGFVGGDAREAQRVTAALASAVIDGDSELRKTQAERARDFLSTQRAEKNAELKTAEQHLATFMGDHRRFALDTTPLAAGAAIRASTVGLAPAAAAPTQLTFGSRVPFRPAAVPGGATPPSSLGSDERARAIAALAAASADLAEQQRHYGPAHPDVRRAQGELERAQARVTALGPAVEIVVPTPRAPETPRPPRVASGTVASAAPAAGPASVPADVVALETDWVKLTREVTAARQRVDQVEAALFKADVLASSEQAGRAVVISVIDPAFLPQRPLGPSSDAILGMFLLSGLVLGLLGAAIGAALDDRIDDDSSILSLTPILAQVPKMAWEGRPHAAR